MRPKQLIAPVLLFVLFGTLLIQLPLAIADRTSAYEWFDPIVDIRRILVDRYVREPDEELMQQAMIDAMIDVLDDPYTEYVPPTDLNEFNKQLRGTYAGIGAEVNIVDGYLVIVSPMDDSPALRAGIMAGDTVLEIEGESTFEVPVDRCVEMLTGEIGTPVTIRVRHLDGAEEDVTIVRGRIITRTVKGIRRLGEAWSFCVDETLGLGYVRVTQFNASTVRELRAVLEQLMEGDLGGLILDLRDNPGGGLDVAVAMADLFLDDGTIVSVRPRVGTERSFTARPEGTLPDFPMIVLVNGNSASASEIVAGALQENRRARILGTRTFGKGSVQEVRELSYRSGTLKYTTAHYYLPNGRNINRTPDDATWGVDPDAGFVVPITDEDYIAGFQARREFEIIRRDADDMLVCVDADWIRESLQDEQSAAATEALRNRVASGTWPTLSDEVSGTVATDQELRRAATARLRLLEQLRQLDERIEGMETRADASGRERLLPDDLDVEGGTLTVRDEDGNVVGEFRLQGGNLLLALDSLALEPLADEE